MCEWGTDTLVCVKIAGHLSHSGNDEWEYVGIDSCIAPLVTALQAVGVDMLASCCGHGRANGRIDLRDGTVIVIPTVSEAAPTRRQNADKREGVKGR